METSAILTSGDSSSCSIKAMSCDNVCCSVIDQYVTCAAVAINAALQRKCSSAQLAMATTAEGASWDEGESGAQ